MLKFIFLLFCTTALSSVSDHLISGCRVFDSQGERVMTFPGSQCEFLRDGRLISFDNKKLRLFSPPGKMEWELSIPAFSDFQISKNENEILVWSNVNMEAVEYKLRVISLSGNVLKEINSDELGITGFHVTDFGPSPDGGYYINVYKQKVYFFDQNFKGKKTQWKISDHKIYSVRFTENENITYLSSHGPSDQHPLYTQIAEWDSRKQTEVFRWPKKPYKGFSFIMGSVRRSKDTYVINHPMQGTYLVSATGDLINFQSLTHFSGLKKILPPEHVYLRDMSSLLKVWNP